MLYTVVMANELAILQQQSLIITQYQFTEIFTVFNDGLSKSAMAAIDSFSYESLSDIDDRNNNVDVGELSDRAKRTPTARVFLMATRTSVMIKVMV